jgi:hypothetical protein
MKAFIAGLRQILRESAIAAENGVIRIGTASQQTQTFIAGINNSTVTGAGVVVDPATGQLGVLASSERFKTGIAAMGPKSAKLGQLPPVTFRLKTDPKGSLQYGLIAERVAEVYPELVIRDASGKIQGVRYDELAPMLLNEMQQQHAQMTASIRDLKQQMAEMRAINQATQGCTAEAPGQGQTCRAALRGFIKRRPARAFCSALMAKRSG